jgi:hypothetical protein
LEKSLEKNNFLLLGQKTLFLGQKVWKKIGNPCSGVKKQSFPKIPNLQKFQNLIYSKLSENYEKMMFNSNFENCKKLVPT